MRAHRPQNYLMTCHRHRRRTALCPRHHTTASSVRKTHHRKKALNAPQIRGHTTVPVRYSRRDQPMASDAHTIRYSSELDGCNFRHHCSASAGRRWIAAGYNSGFLGYRFRCWGQGVHTIHYSVLDGCKGRCRIRGCRPGTKATRLMDAVSIVAVFSPQGRHRDSCPLPCLAERRSILECCPFPVSCLRQALSYSLVQHRSCLRWADVGRNAATLLLAPQRAYCYLPAHRCRPRDGQACSSDAEPHRCSRLAAAQQRCSSDLMDVGCSLFGLAAVRQRRSLAAHRPFQHSCRNWHAFLRA